MVAVRQLTETKAHEILDVLIAAFYSTGYFKEMLDMKELHSLWSTDGETRATELRELAVQYQYPIMEKHGFDASPEGQQELTAACFSAGDAEVVWKCGMLKVLSSGERQSFGPSPLETKVRASVRSRYHRDGYVFPMRALTPFHITEVLAGFMRFKERHIMRVPACGAHKMNHAWLPWLRDLARHPTITSAVAEALGSRDIYLWDSELVTRSPRESQFTESGIGWHRDSAQVMRLKPLDRNHIVTAFVALTVSTQRRGCLVAQGKGAQAVVPLELLPGQFALIAPSTHRTGALNESSEPSYGVLLRYVKRTTQDLDASAKGQSGALLVLGNDPQHDNFAEMPDVEGEATDAGLELRRRLLDRRQPASIPKQLAWAGEGQM